MNIKTILTALGLATATLVAAAPADARDYYGDGYYSRDYRNDRWDRDDRRDWRDHRRWERRHHRDDRRRWRDRNYGWNDYGRHCWIERHYGDRVRVCR